MISNIKNFDQILEHNLNQLSDKTIAEKYITSRFKYLHRLGRKA